MINFQLISFVPLMNVVIKTDLAVRPARHVNIMSMET